MRTLFYHLIMTWCRYLWVLSTCLLGMIVAPYVTANSSITYMTRMDAVVWEFSGSKFMCQLTHNINDFGAAVFERRAGEYTRFVLQSQNPRMKSGEATLISQPPQWLEHKPSVTIANVNVLQSETPVRIKRKISERMLAELQKGMDLHFVREPWYGDNQSLEVIVPSVGFRKTHGDYLNCLGRLLPVNFSQVQKKSLYYSNEDESLSRKDKSYLDKLAAYIKEDAAVKSIYIDGHTDSNGVRSENLIKSKERAERVMEYLLSQGISNESMVVRWHGERYQVASNQTKKGSAKNRRVTVRISKAEPRRAVKPPTSQGDMASVDKNIEMPVMKEGGQKIDNPEALPDNAPK